MCTTYCRKQTDERALTCVQYLIKKYGWISLKYGSPSHTFTQLCNITYFLSFPRVEIAWSNSSSTLFWFFQSTMILRTADYYLTHLGVCTPHFSWRPWHCGRDRLAHPSAASHIEPLAWCHYFNAADTNLTDVSQADLWIPTSNYVRALKLNRQRYIGPDGLTAERILHAHTMLIAHHCCLFKAIFIHSYMPEDFELGIIVPLVKDN